MDSIFTEMFNRGPGTGSAATTGRPAAAGPGARALGWAAALGIGATLLVMLAVAAAGRSKAVVWLPAAGPPWRFSLHPSATLVSIVLWSSAVAGALSVAAGIAAVSRGARPRARWMVAAALAVTAVFAVLPPAGSTDTLDYASYGRMVVLGHSPYLMTPARMRRLGDPVARQAPSPWQHDHSVYGPLASAEQAAAAELGGRSAARITFWLKLWTALAFGAVVLALDRMLRADPARRARAHLLWSLNPLLLWVIVAAGHVDGLAAAAGFFALAVMGRQRPLEPPGTLRALAAGVLAGAAAGLKVTYSVFGVGVLWAARRSPPALAAAVAGLAVALLPGYLWLGRPALRALVRRSDKASAGNFYQFLARVLLGERRLPGMLPLAVALCVALAVLLLYRLPDGVPDRPGVRPALVLSLAWLFVWPYQYPWYDAMLLCLLVLYLASRLDWLVLARLAAGTLFTMPGMPGKWARGAMAQFIRTEELYLVPVVRLAALVVLAGLAITGAWYGPP